MGHGVAGVDGQVHQHLVELRGVGQDAGQRSGSMRLTTQVDLSKVSLQQFIGVAHQGRDTGPAGLPALPGEGEHRHQCGAALHRCGLLDVARSGRAVAWRPRPQLGEA